MMNSATRMSLPQVITAFASAIATANSPTLLRLFHQANASLIAAIKELGQVSDRVGRTSAEIEGRIEAYRLGKELLAGELSARGFWRHPMPEQPAQHCSIGVSRLSQIKSLARLLSDLRAALSVKESNS